MGGGEIGKRTYVKVSDRNVLGVQAPSSRLAYVKILIGA